MKSRVQGCAMTLRASSFKAHLPGVYARSFVSTLQLLAGQCQRLHLEAEYFHANWTTCRNRLLLLSSCTVSLCASGTEPRRICQSLGRQVPHANIKGPNTDRQNMRLFVIQKELPQKEPPQLMETAMLLQNGHCTLGIDVSRPMTFVAKARLANRHVATPLATERHFTLQALEGFKVSFLLVYLDPPMYLYEGPYSLY